MDVLKIFKIILVALTVLLPLGAFLSGETTPYPYIIGLTSGLYLVYMFFFDWDENGDPFDWSK